jgi:hypothetical protein
VRTDDSSWSEVSDGDIEAEVVESNSIFDGDGLLLDLMIMRRTFVSSVLPNPRLWLGKS